MLIVDTDQPEDRSGSCLCYHLRYCHLELNQHLPSFHSGQERAFTPYQLHRSSNSGYRLGLPWKYRWCVMSKHTRTESLYSIMHSHNYRIEVKRIYPQGIQCELRGSQPECSSVAVRIHPDFSHNFALTILLYSLAIVN